MAELLEDSSLSEYDALFLVEMGQMDAAENYVLERADQLNGDFYSGLLPLTEAMETTDRWLCASIIYRALLDSILHRGQTKAYSHGARYLKRLDRLAESVSDWRSFENHRAYVEKLRQQHGRKRSFWARYEK